MFTLDDLPVWEKIFKEIVLKQIGPLKGKRILDFGSGIGVISSFYAASNEVIAIEPSQEAINNAWKDYSYKQIEGDISACLELEEESFDYVICHNVLEYIDDKEKVVKELCRLLKKNGTLSIVKHNPYGRVMQMSVLLNDFSKAKNILEGGNSFSATYGEIKYYQDEDISSWCSSLQLVNKFGIRTFFDLQQNQEIQKEEKWQKEMIELEEKVSQIPSFYNISFFHHLIYKKK